jgi:AcrR family transcriptional regulator
MQEEAAAVETGARRRRWESHRARRRGDIVEAAVRAIRRRGAAVTMDEIAAEAGVAKPVLYRMFRDKAELYRAAGAAVAERLLIPALVAELAVERHPREHAAAMIDTYLRLIDAEPELYRFVVHPPLDERPAAPDLVGTYKQVIAEHLARIIEAPLREAHLDPALARPWAHALVGMVHEAGDWWIEHRSIRREELTAHLTALVWGGVAAVYQGGDRLGVLATQPAQPLR